MRQDEYQGRLALLDLALLCIVAFVVAVRRAAVLVCALLAFILAGPPATDIQISITHVQVASTWMLKVTAGPCCAPGKGNWLGKAILSARLSAWEPFPCHFIPAPELRL